MAKFYYDTGIFGYFLFRNDWEHQFSPTKVQGYTSVFCDEELIYAHMNGKFKDLGADVTFLEISEKILNIGAIFQPHSISLGDIRSKFIYMMGSLVQNNVDLRQDFLKHEQKASEPKPLSGTDWMHLAVADLIGCDVILTNDNDFKYLLKVGKYLKLENVKKIFIFASKDKLEKVDEVVFG